MDFVTGNLGKSVLLGLLCGLLATDQTAAFAANPKQEKALQHDQRVLHALNRLTFGPRPGEVRAVEKMGLQRWFEQQLHPESIDDSALDARLAAFPAMQLPQDALMQRFPGGQVLRQTLAQNRPLPSDPTEHAIYADGIAFAAAAKTRKDAADATTLTSGNAGSPMQPVKSTTMQGIDTTPPATSNHQEEFFPEAQAFRVLNLAPDQRMQKILSMRPAEFMAFHRSLSRAEINTLSSGLSAVQREILASLGGAERVVREEVAGTRMLRDVYSQRELQAVMTDFWLNHFNVFLNKNGNEPYLLPAYERDAIRPNALGKFEDLLVAVAESPAMLVYLDNWQSVGPDSPAAARAANQPNANPKRKDIGLNENYARELMELHTLGAQCEVSADHSAKALPKPCGKGYTQADVTEVAKVFTGWTIDRPYLGSDFQFDERRHEPGNKIVLGATVAANGQQEGFQLLHMLATSPATAHFVSQKLAIRFVSDTPSPKLVDRMAKAWMHSDGDIKAVLQAMFNAPEFWSPQVYRAKVKTPEEFLISAVRASGADISNPVPLSQTLTRLGMPFYGMQTPNGYDWKAEPWVNTGDLVNRMNLALVMSSDRLPGVAPNWSAPLELSHDLAHPISSTAPDSSLAVKEEMLEHLLLGEAASSQTRSTVLSQASQSVTEQSAEKSFPVPGKNPRAVVAALSSAPKRTNAVEDPQASTMAGLLLGSPEFQRR